jgi:hypothetical protein
MCTPVHHTRGHAELAELRLPAWLDKLVVASRDLTKVWKSRSVVSKYRERGIHKLS